MDVAPFSRSFSSLPTAVRTLFSSWLKYAVDVTIGCSSDGRQATI